LGTYQNEAIVWNGGVENGGKGSTLPWLTVLLLGDIRRYEL